MHTATEFSSTQQVEDPDLVLDPSDAIELVSRACPRYRELPGFENAALSVVRQVMRDGGAVRKPVRLRLHNLSQELIPRYFGDLRSDADYKFARRQIELACPSYRKYPDFDDASCMVIREAMSNYDPARGTFVARLRYLAKLRIPRHHERDPSLLARKCEVVSLQALAGVGTNTWEVEGPDPTGPDLSEDDLVWEADRIADLLGPSHSVDVIGAVISFASQLTDQERIVAEGLSSGHSQKDIAHQIGVHPRKTSRIVDEIRRKAAIFFGRGHGKLPLAA